MKKATNIDALPEGKVAHCFRILKKERWEKDTEVLRNTGKRKVRGDGPRVGTAGEPWRRKGS